MDGTREINFLYYYFKLGNKTSYEFWKFPIRRINIKLGRAQSHSNRIICTFIKVSQMFIFFFYLKCDAFFCELDGILL